METIKISEESLKKFSHDKNVVGITQSEIADNTVKHPFNIMDNGFASASEIINFLFTFDVIIDRQIPSGEYRVLGFILNIPFCATYRKNSNRIYLKAIDPSYVERSRYARIKKPN